MEKFYCSKCKVELNKLEVKAQIKSMVEDSGHGSPTFYKTVKYYCIKHNLPIEIEVIEK